MLRGCILYPSQILCTPNTIHVKKKSRNGIEGEEGKKEKPEKGGRGGRDYQSPDASRAHPVPRLLLHPNIQKHNKSNQGGGTKKT